MVVPPQNHLLPAVTKILTFLKKEGRIFLNTWAREMPMKASGSLSLRQAAILVTPIPGSTTTGIAPALKRAKMIVKKSKDGFTINMVRMPFVTPLATRPAASLFDCSLSCSKVKWV